VAPDLINSTNRGNCLVYAYTSSVQVISHSGMIGVPDCKESCTVVHAIGAWNDDHIYFY